MVDDDDAGRPPPLSGAPNGLQIWPPDEEQEVAVAPYQNAAEFIAAAPETFSSFFLRK